jgi:glyoxylase-like metal-dependent hydrolase (beta-lactamase superfamily II)
MSTAAWSRHPGGVTTVDAAYVRPGLASVHVLERAGRAMLIDSGTNDSVPLVLRALAELGLAPDAVDWLFLTHVHLDHAGGAGQLLAQLPRARVLVHPRGLSHLVDPTRLEVATIAVYGEAAYRKLYGALAPIPAARVQSTADGERLRLGGSELTILHTPGHALHHQILFEPEAGAVFTGDTFGLSYRELDTAAGAFIVPTTTPSQFDPPQLLHSVGRIVALGPTAAYLTHFGRVTDVARLGDALREQIEHFVVLARAQGGPAEREGARQARIRAALRDYLVTRASAHGVADPATTVERVLGPDLELNAQGLVAWLQRAEKRASG